MFKKIGVIKLKDFWYFFLLMAIFGIILLFFSGAIYQMVTGWELHHYPRIILRRMSVQFPYLLYISVFFMYFSVSTLFIMGIAGIFYRKKKDRVTYKEDKRISIIIPAHNEENVVKNIILDLLKQTYQNMEILVICHNCRDRTAERAREVKNEKVKVIELNTRKSGKALALNRALEMAEGEIIAHFDTDNQIQDKNFLRRLAFYFEDESIDGVQSKLSVTNPTESILTMMQKIEFDIFNIIGLAGRNALGLPCFLSGTGTALRKEVIEEVGGWSNSLVEDFELFTRLSRKGKRLEYGNNLVTFDEKPSTWASLLKQRSRWVKGHIQVALDNIDYLGNGLDYLYRLIPFSVFSFWISSGLYGFYFLTGQSSVWDLGNNIWIGWTSFFILFKISLLLKTGGIKRVFFLFPQWFFSLHWLLVGVMALKVKSWAQTKTVHNGIPNPREVKT